MHRDRRVERRGRVHSLIAAPLLFVASGLSAQTAPLIDSPFASGISVQAGLGQYSVRDEYFSAERYSGTLPYLSVSWTRLPTSGA